MPKGRVVRADYLLPGVRTLKKFTSNRIQARVLQAEGLPTSILDQPSALIPLKDLAAIYQRAARALGTKDFGVAVADNIHTQEFGLLFRYALQGATLFDAFRRMFSIYPIEVSGQQATLSVVGSVATVVRKSEARSLVGWHHTADTTACQWVNLVRHFAGRDWKPTEMHLDYPRAQRSRDFEEFVSCPVNYGADAMTLSFPIHTLQLPNPRRLDERKVMTLTDVCRSHRSQFPTSTRNVVESIIRWRLGAGKIDRCGVALKLGVTPRTLQRKLEDEGTNYSFLLEKVRRKQAYDLLSESSLSVRQISKMLSYHHQEHFSRAFKRWFNVSPVNFRRQGS